MCWSLSLSLFAVTYSFRHSLTHSYLGLGGEVFVPGAQKAGVKICAAAVYQDHHHDRRDEKAGYDSDTVHAV